MARKGENDIGLDRLEQIKKLVIVAMFSDPQLEDLLVLKGGNAIDLVHGLGARASVDVDFSMANDLPEDAEQFRQRVENALNSTFHPEGYEAFDVRLVERPEVVSPELAGFWGGYAVEFKLLPLAVLSKIAAGDFDATRRQALRLGQGTRFMIDISRHEYVAEKEPQYLDGFRVFVYSSAMIACEKLRAICQQTPEYGAIVKRGRPGAPRARDFLDIYTLINEKELDLSSAASHRLLRNVFDAKRVPLKLLGQIVDYREFHRLDWPAVQATIKVGVQLRDFDFYFDYVIAIARSLESLWNE